MAKNFIAHTQQNAANLDTQFYVYQRWARKNSGQLDYKAKWDSPYVQPSVEWWNKADDVRAFYGSMVDTLNADLPNLQKKVLMVPVGDVFYELQTRIKAGQVPGYSDITQLYTDDVHLNTTGSFLVGTTFYATLYKEDPNGMAVPSHWGSVNPQTAALLRMSCGTWSARTRKPASFRSRGARPC
jgi:hypothetical protein